MSNFFVLLLAGVILAKIPVINLPLAWFETFFHELSHMLIGLLTGGSVINMELYWDGSGLCRITDDMPFPTFYAGYLCAPMWGFWLYLIGRISLPSTLAVRKIKTIILIMVITTILWVRDGNTLIIMGFMLGVLGLTIWKIEEYHTRNFIRFCGIYIMLNAVHAPLYIYSHRIAWDDGVALAALTGLPKFLFVALWHGNALLMLMAAAYIPWVLKEAIPDASKSENYSKKQPIIELDNPPRNYIEL